MTTRTKAKTEQKKSAAKAKKAPAAKKKPAKKRVPKKDPKPPGRPAWEPDLGNVENWARNGLNDGEIAALCGVAKQTFSIAKTEKNEQGDDSELCKALARGRAKGTNIAASALMKNIAQGDTQAIKFYLERKAGWKQHQVIEKAKSVEEMTDEELREMLDRLEKEATA